VNTKMRLKHKNSKRQIRNKILSNCLLWGFKRNVI